MKKLYVVILIISMLLCALPVAANGSAGTKPPVGYQAEEYWRELKVDVSTTKGRLLKNWELFIKMNYKGWKIEQNPMVDQYGRYFVVLGRWSVRFVPIMLNPALYCNDKRFPQAPNCPPIKG